MYQTYVGISTIDFDLRGSVLFRARLEDSELKNYSRRVTRTGTLDGGVSITDSGYSHGDRTITINAELTEEQVVTLTYIFQNYSQVILAIPEGIFTASLSTMNNVYGTVTLQLWINEKLTTSPDELPIYYCARDDTFAHINHWSLTKLAGSETATAFLKGLTDWECRLDLVDSVNSQLNMLYQYILPAGDFDVRIDVADYLPDLATAGFTLEFKLKSTDGNYYSSAKYYSTASGVFTLIRTHKDGAVTTTDTAAGITEPATLKVERVGNELNLYYFANSWSSAFTRDFGSNSGEIDEIEIIMTSGAGNRGGRVDIDNLMFHSGCPLTYPKAWSTTCTSTTSCTSSTASTTSCTSSISTTSSSTTSTSSCSSTSSTASTASTLTTTTSSSSSTCSSSTSSSSSTCTTSSSQTTTTTYSCLYDEHFTSLTNWNFTYLQGTETASIVGNKLRLDVPNGINGEVKGRYLYQLPSGDFNITLDCSDYNADHATLGPWAKLLLSNPAETVYARVAVQGDQPPINPLIAIVGLETRAGGTPQTSYKVLNSYSVRLNISRTGTTIAAAFDDGSGWTSITSRDFGADASALIYLYLLLEDNTLNGGEVKFDTLAFGSNCPDGTIAWTTSSTTTTSCTSTSTTLSSTSSTASTASTLSTTSSTASTLSTTSSSSSCTSTASTASTLSTTSSTISSSSTTTTALTTTCSSTSSTASTLSTTHTTTTCSSTSSTASTASTLSTTTSSHTSTSSTASSLSTTSCTTTCSSTSSSTESTASTLSTTSSCSTSSSTASTVSTTTSSLSTTTTTTYWCEYNETFTDTDSWDITEQEDGGETFTIVSGEGQLDLPDSVSSAIRIEYQYFIGSGDFILDLDLSSYSKDAGAGDDGPLLQFFADDASGEPGNNRVHIQFYDDNGTYKANFYYKIDGGATQNVGAESTGGLPDALRITRSGNNLAGYYYISGSWDIIGSAVDFSTHASNIDIVKLRWLDSGNSRGGAIKFDNLRFRDGCPSGYPKVWTTTTSSCTTTTTTTEPPP